MRAIILAGGLGTRLRDSVPDLPKPMAPVAGRPFLAYQFDFLHQHNFQHITLAVGYRSEAIRDYFGDAYQGISLQYVYEEEPLGTGGALVQALRESENHTTPVWVLNGDTFLDFSPKDAYQSFLKSKADFLMLLKEMFDFSRYGAVEVDAQGRILAFREKEARTQGWINAGVYLFRPQLLLDRGFPQRFSLENDFLQQDMEQIQIQAFPTTGYFIDIGVPEDYEQAQADFRRMF